MEKNYFVFWFKEYGLSFTFFLVLYTVLGLMFFCGSSTAVHSLIVFNNHIETLNVLTLMLLFVEPLMISDKNGWNAQKVFWTAGIVVFYAILLIGGCSYWKWITFIPLITYMLRVLVPFKWVVKWIRIFVEFKE